MVKLFLISVILIVGFTAKILFFSTEKEMDSSDTTEAISSAPHTAVAPTEKANSAQPARPTGLNQNEGGASAPYASEDDRSPTGDPDLDRVYQSNPEWAKRWDEYKEDYQEAQSTNSQPPSPPESPTVDEERMRISSPPPQNPFAAAEENETSNSSTESSGSSASAAPLELPEPPPPPPGSTPVPVMKFRGTSE